MRKIVVLKKRGNIAGLAKHLSHKHGGDPGFFTACMSDDELQGYGEDARAGICAKAHKLAIGKWPGEHPRKKKEKARRFCCGRTRRQSV